LLPAATVVALAWANSPWSESYDRLWHGQPLDLGHWVNEGLMTVFFLVVGLEIKRELVDGELRDKRTAMVPVVAALGGMVVPAAIYAALNRGGPGSRGWGIVMATDIAFALGVASVLGPRRVPAPAKLFLLTLAVVDDIGAIVVIALFYADDVHPTALALALVATVAVLVAAWRGVTAIAVYVGLGVALWVAVYQSGLHPTVAGVVLGLAMPAATAGRRSETALDPWVQHVVLPVFVLANAGVNFGMATAAFDAPGTIAVGAGVAVGLAVGKPLGIAGATWLVVRFGRGRLPVGTTWAHIAGVGFLGGIGFTVSLFVADLAFAEGARALEDSAKVGIVAASTLSAAAALIWFRDWRSAGRGRRR
jgi:NhaA family Na+:H+ antiporter